MRHLQGKRRRGARRRAAGSLVFALLLAAAAAADPAPRGSPASRIGPADAASEYWDLTARFDSGHVLFARFMITNEGPGEKTGIAYGHFIEPDGTTHWWKNGRQQQNWSLEEDGHVLDVGSSELMLTGPPYRLKVRKKKKGIDIDLRFTPEAPAAWNARADAAAPAVDLLAGAAQVTGSVWFRAMAEPVTLSGRAGLTHTWSDGSETDAMRRRIDFFSLQGDAALYVTTSEAPAGGSSRWLRLARGGETIFETSDFTIREHGHSAAQQNAGYPIPARLELSGPEVAGSIQIGVGLLHHDPMQVIPQPFRLLLSFKMRPQRVWAESPFEVTVTPGADPVRIRGAGVANITYLNPATTPR